MDILANFEYVYHYLNKIVPVINTDHPDFYPNGIKLFLLLCESGNTFVELNEGDNYGKLLYDGGHGGWPSYTFNSIKSYLYFTKQCYSNKWVYLDKDGCLECDFEKFYQYKQDYLANQII
ncbi:MAG: hypothetical protein M0D57_17725 [Sphingobacteriales bacterium JAD_PAG50586_3]|nr:MAG: hypothetical protein M0D57_17725 [Sphingobacteriales bacterium JAD_PAG50586_3]